MLIMGIILKWLTLTASILISAYVIPGVTVTGLWPALILAIILGLINVLLKPILIVVTLPINILTLGLFTFVINALLIMLAGTIVKGFDVGSFWNALLFGIVLSVVNFVLSKMLDPLK
jgi:putative membrane protein